MKQSRELKAEHKRLKRLVKQEPSLFARLADVELTLGKTKGALRRLENGLDDYPEHTSARSIYADCLSQLGDHESSLKQWEEVIYAEPMNQKARAGYIRELAYLERTDSMSDALAELYLIDPFDDEIEERHKDSMLQSIRSRHPAIRAWNPQWHPGDFTGLGAVARAAVYSNNLLPKRDHLPDGFEPSLDEAAMQALLEKMPKGEVGQDLEASIGEMVGQGSEADVAFDEDDITDALDSLGLDNEEIDVVAVEPDQTEEAEERALSALLEDDDAAAAEDQVVDEADEEEEPEPEPPVQDNPLIAALKAAKVDTEGMVDIESIVNQLDVEEVPIVEPPDIEAGMDEEEEEITQIAEEVVEEETPAKSAEPEDEITQDELDALMIESDGEQEPAVTEPDPPSIEEPTEALGGPLTQDQLDALFSSGGFGAAAAEVEPEPVTEPETQPSQQAEPQIEESTEDLETVPGPEPDDLTDEPGPVEQPLDVDEVESGEEETAEAEVISPEEDVVSTEKAVSDQDDVAADTPDEGADETAEVAEAPIDLSDDPQIDEVVNAADSDQSDDEPAEEAATTTEEKEDIVTESPAASSGFDIDRWFAARREKRIREQAEQEETGTADKEPILEAEGTDSSDSNLLNDLEDEVVDEGVPVTEQDVTEEESLSEVVDSAVEPDDEALTVDAADVQTEEETAVDPPRPDPIPGLKMPETPVRPAPPAKPATRDDEIAPEEIRGPVTKTFAKLYMQQGKMEHAAEIVRRLLLDTPDDEEVLELKAKIDERLA